MPKTIAALGSALFFVVAPLVLAGLRAMVDHTLGVPAGFFRL